ncbi:M56 family metallopeptidase [Cochleicola gelatinilyticus]|uniref:BlaR1 peptidase M56 n=1 Tax=Cochleicola gelatinilyticus TaxID=1763537 RepID=A0A167IQY7_9FLAO|nr:M56 family metallopeptidase [Cochleicola gelatinilyticus]OAB79928.1 hypothetical protein ULVI_04095 [Cochleicola gelatinilyticus]
MIHVAIQIIAFQLLFLLVYDVFLKKETFFKANRWYLLGTAVLSFILPFLKIDALRERIPEQFFITLPAVLIGNNGSQPGISEITLDAVTISQTSWNWITIATWIWCVGMGIALAIFLLKLFKIQKLRRAGILRERADFNLIILPNTDVAFTFFDTVYLGDQLSEVQQKSILLHEQVHVTEKHTYDLLFFELLRIVCWFNPLVYVFQHRMETLHEFTADARVAAQKSRKEYYQELLSQVFQTEKISFINTFFNHSLIKKRIIMLQKSKSKNIFQLKYLVLIPAVCAMLLYTSCSDESKIEEATVQDDGEVMTKINELSEAIMKKGNLTDEEAKALKFLATEATPDAKVYESVQEYLDVSNKAEIPFAIIDKVPTFPGCEGMSNADAKQCMSQKIQAFVAANFNTKVGNNLGLTGRQKIRAQFKIDAFGKVVDLRVRAEHEALAEEAQRVISSLPQMTPGEHDGKQVAVLYALPILFEINE